MKDWPSALNNGLGVSVNPASMAYDFDDPQYWRDRAEQVRALADGVSNERARNAIFEIAAEYELLADSAQERAKGGIQ